MQEADGGLTIPILSLAFLRQVVNGAKNQRKSKKEIIS